ncbi:hypothetical protein [Micromonospora sp. SL4-19]|uniref:hypothetical protein n=1 Tax=Micromonospora sp. SL4-19 TaxID=3399129 RepID=UPI003A4E05EF
MVNAVARHLAGMAAAWLVVVAEAVVGYLGLLAFALATESDPGGPLAGPVLVLVAAMYGVALQPLLFLPAVAVAEATGRQRGAGRVLALAAAIAGVLAAGYAVAAAVATDVSAGHLPLVAGIAVLLVLPPVLVYALTARGVGWMARRLTRRWDAAAAQIRAEQG